MINETPFEKIDFRAIIENYIVFFIFGVVVIIYGYFSFNLTEELPVTYISIVQEPISLNVFAILSLLSLGVIALICFMKNESAIKEDLINKYILAFSRAGLSTGSIAAGMLMGIGVMIWLISFNENYTKLAEHGLSFIYLSVFTLLFLVPVIIMHLYILYPWKEKVTILNIASIAYIIIVTTCLFIFSNYLNWKGVGIELSIFLVLAFIFKSHYKK